jgi:SCY1-like protein 1
MGQGLASNLPYEVGENFSCLKGKTVWSVHKGKKKADARHVTVFAYDVKSGNEEQLKVAKEAYQKLKTFRHPSVVTFIDGIQVSQCLFIFVCVPVFVLLCINNIHKYLPLMSMVHFSFCKDIIKY